MFKKKQSFRPLHRIQPHSNKSLHFIYIVYLKRIFRDLIEGPTRIAFSKKEKGYTLCIRIRSYRKDEKRDIHPKNEKSKHSICMVKVHLNKRPLTSESLIKMDIFFEKVYQNITNYCYT